MDMKLKKITVELGEFSSSDDEYWNKEAYKVAMGWESFFLKKKDLFSWDIAIVLLEKIWTKN